MSTAVKFEAFATIHKIGKLDFSITQKIHGTNAHILIMKNEDGSHFVQAASRTRFIYPGDDNYGFAAWVQENREELIEKLGVGRHDGEWAGPGINSGEGLTKKTFVLFDWWKFPPERVLPKDCVPVPLLYRGKMDLDAVRSCMEDLQQNGSRLVPGFLRCEGVVISINGVRYKKVFDAEETQWKQSDGQKDARKKAETLDYSHLLQPIRLEKLLSRDEKYVREYPVSLPQIVKDYVADLIKEEQIVGDPDMIKAITKGASAQIFKFVKQLMEENVY